MIPKPANQVHITLFLSGTSNIYVAAQDLNSGNSGWSGLGTWTPPTSYTPVIRLDPSCLDAASCTLVGLGVGTRNPVASTLSGYVTLEARGPARTVYSSIFVDYYRAPSCAEVFEGDISTGGPSSPTLPNSATHMGRVRTETAILSQYSLGFEQPAQIPGFYFSRVVFVVTATWPTPTQPLPQKTFTFQSNCVRVGDAPLITGLRDDLSGQTNAIDRGTAGPYLQLYGSRFAGISGTSTAIQPTTGISDWRVSYVDPAIGRANITYNVSATAPIGQRQFTLTNGAGTSLPVALWITDPTPEIIGVEPNQPWVPGDTVTVSLSGKGFGSQPAVDLVVADGVDLSDCLGSGQVSILLANDTSIQFTKTVPSSSPGCEFNINVMSNGLSGSFLQGPGASPKQRRASKPGSVVKQSTKLPIKVFIVHGIGDAPTSMADLALNLQVALAQPPINLGGKFDIDYRFTFRSTRPALCDDLDDIGASLGNYVLSKSQPFQRFVLIGHSMGGLVIRTMMKLRDLDTNSRRFVVGLVTLGTPHLGYPYLGIDTREKCANQSSAMDSYLLNGGSLDDPGVLRTDFLRTLRADWRIADYGGRFFSAGGAVCNEQTRYFLGYGTNGCRPPVPYPPGFPPPDGNELSDGVVCQDSAALLYPDSGITPTNRFTDPARVYRHSPSTGYTGLNVLCATLPGQPLSNPDPNGSLVILLKQFLAGLYE